MRLASEPGWENRDVGIMIVEDEHIVARDIEHTIRDLGYTSLGIASSSERALALARETAPSLVLMDIRLKGESDGIETAALLKREFDIPVIYLTAHADQSTLHRAALTSPHGYLLKPLRSADLQSAIAVGLVKHRLEIENRKRERWHSTLLQSIADAVVAVDAECRVTYMNKGAEDMVGFPQTVALGKELRLILRLMDEDGAPLDFDSVARSVRAGETIDLPPGHLQNLTTGRDLFVERSTSSVVDHDEVLGAVMMLRDTTAARAVQRRLVLSERLASLGTMAAGVAHEINNPLMVVTGNTSLLAHRLRALAKTLKTANGELLAERSDIDSFGEICDEILEAGSRIREIVSDLGAFSRPPSSDESMGDVSRALQWATRSTRHLLRHCAKVEIEIEPVPPVVLDDTKLGQIFVNLLSNAADAIGAGDADRNRVHIALDMSATGLVRIRFSDTGCGMSESIIRRVLEPFFTTKDVGRGTGLGLSITHHLVTSVGGHFDIQSEEGHGTTITLDIPVAPTPRHSEPTPPHVSASRGARILFIDDQESIRKVVSRLLSHHEVTVASTGTDALTLLGEGRTFDIILCDFMMPMMTGEQFLGRVRKFYPHLVDKVAFVTGGAIGTRESHVLSQSQQRVLKKPFKLQELESLIAEFSSRS